MIPHIDLNKDTSFRLSPPPTARQGTPERILKAVTPVFALCKADFLTEISRCAILTYRLYSRRMPKEQIPQAAPLPYPLPPGLFPSGKKGNNPFDSTAKRALVFPTEEKDELDPRMYVSLPLQLYGDIAAGSPPVFDKSSYITYDTDTPSQRLSKAIVRKDVNPDSYADPADSYVKIKNYEAALKYIRRGLHFYPENEELLRLETICLREYVMTPPSESEEAAKMASLRARLERQHQRTQLAN